MISDAVLLEYIRPSTSADLPTLRRLEKAAIAMIEQKTGRYFGVTATITETLLWRGWPMMLANPTTSLTTFTSWDGTAFTAVDASSYSYAAPFIYFNAVRSSWTPLSMPSRYVVTYTAGYAVGATADEWAAPEDIKQAVLLLVGHWFENREAVVVGASSSGELPLAVSALLDGHVRATV